MPESLLKILHTNTPITFIIAVLVFIFSILSLYKPSFFIKMILHPHSVFTEKQYYRIFTSEFVHNDIAHLALNEFMLILVGGGLEETLNLKSSNGGWEFLFVYLFSYFTGIIYSTIKHRNDFNFSSAGASGSVMGLFFSFIILRPNYTAFYLPGVGGVKNMYGGLIYIAVLTFLQYRRKDSVTNHELHFFGAIGGLIATFLLFPDILKI